MTQPDQHESRAAHVKATWGKRCNILFFVSSIVDDNLPSIAITANESRSILWGKTKLGFQVKIVFLCSEF
jgi:glycoprotein-N-acetylgalactosamine 3-beta-galactosyltransferase